LTGIDVREVIIDEKRMLAVGSDDRRLLRECYAVLLTVADLIQTRGASVGRALTDALDGWRRLLGELSILSVDAQVGLLGELWVAHRLLSSHGRSAVNSWLGPTGQAHDFRFADIELEVKATRGAERRHMISSLTQLVPSPGLRLYLVSIQLASAGGSPGVSVPTAVGRIQNQLGGATEEAALFFAHLDALGYRDEHAGLYSAEFRLRSAPVLIEADRSLPILSPVLLRDSFGPAAAARFENVTYTLNVEGLGWPEASSPFQQVLPKPARGDLL